MGGRKPPACAAGGHVVTQLWLPIVAVAALLGVSSTTVRRWTAERRIPQPVRIARTVRWRAADLDQLELVAASPEFIPYPGNRTSLPGVAAPMSHRGPGRGVVKKRVVKGKVVWYGDWRDASGKRRRVDFGATRTEAEQLLSKVIRERDLHLAGMSVERGLAMSFGELVEQYTANLEGRTKRGAAERARRQLERVRAGIGARFVRDITKAAFLRWQAGLVRDGLSNNGANNYYVVIMAALNLCVRLGQLNANPLNGLQRLPTKDEHARRPARAATDAEIGLIFHAAVHDDERFNGFPQAPLLFALVHVGARISETTSLTWADFVDEPPSLRFRAETTKTSTAKIVPVARHMAARIAALRAAHERVRGAPPEPGDRIFLSRFGKPHKPGTGHVRAWLYRIMDLAGVARVDPAGGHVHIHALRHTFATRLARAGVSLQQAQVLTGHKSAAVLARVYTHLRAEDARNAIECLPAIRVDASVPMASAADSPAQPPDPR